MAGFAVLGGTPDRALVLRVLRPGWVRRLTVAQQLTGEPSIGHNVPQEAPQPFAQAIIDADHL
ncbi:hypothetical protein EBN03_19100 [Nocardia stercoris]|uniref:Uncharacterized protein n=1 Tax=Nocardia stercoris TaxID=2483361 RepID=A0A3M2LA44_9NOCA|nr:hypothetical protein EBN03_19100 [Nocardia stercoris]